MAKQGEEGQSRRILFLLKRERKGGRCNGMKVTEQIKVKMYSK